MATPPRTTSRKTATTTVNAAAPRRGIQSIAIGYKVLQCLAESRKPMFLREIAQAVGMPTSKVYRHLASFVELELVKPVEGRGCYDLGPAAIQLGLAALRRLDEVSVAVEGLATVMETLDLDAHLTVWGDNGPTVIRWRGRPAEVAFRVSEGHVLPLATSATGRLWCFHLPPSILAGLLKRSLDQSVRQAGRSRTAVRKDYEARLALIAQCGLSHSQEELRHGIDALSGPIFDRDGRLAFAVTVLGIHGDVDLDPAGRSGRSLRRVLNEISMQLGYQDPRGGART